MEIRCISPEVMQSVPRVQEALLNLLFISPAAVNVGLSLHRCAFQDSTRAFGHRFEEFHPSNDM